jgi:hypothetical protein
MNFQSKKGNLSGKNYSKGNVMRNLFEWIAIVSIPAFIIISSIVSIIFQILWALFTFPLQAIFLEASFGFPHFKKINKN